MNRRPRKHEDESVRRPPERDVSDAKQRATRPDEWQALQSALGNQRLQELMEQQREKRTRRHALDEAPMLIPPGMQARISRMAERDSASSRDVSGGDGVRIHEGPAAEDLAQDLGARAFTQGHDVFLGAGGHDRVTLAHELTHASEGTAVAGSVQRLGLDEEEEDEVIIIDDDVIDPTETMDPFAGQPRDDRESIDPTETMDPFKDEPSRKVESIDPTETLDPFKEKGEAGTSKASDTDAKSVGLEADYRTMSDVGEKFSKNVLVPLQEAVSFIYGGAGNAQEVYANVGRAMTGLKEIAKSYTGSEVLGEQIATSYNMLAAIEGWLEPYVGASTSIETIQKQLERAASAFEGVMKRLDIQGTVE
jgi:hypothetical protein